MGTFRQNLGVHVILVIVISFAFALESTTKGASTLWFPWRLFPAWFKAPHRTSLTSSQQHQEPVATTTSISLFRGWPNPGIVFNGALTAISRRITSWLWREVPNDHQNNRFFVDRLGPLSSSSHLSSNNAPMMLQHHGDQTTRQPIIVRQHESLDFTNEVIDGGRVVRNRRRFPYMARLRAVFEAGRKNDFGEPGVEVFIRRCSGSLVHHEWVLTAAHCVIMDGSTATEATVTLGDLNAEDEEGTEVRRVVNSTAFVVPGYFEQRGSRLFNDVALIRLTPAVTIFGASGILPSVLVPNYYVDKGTTGGIRAAAAMMRANVRPIQLSKRFADDYVSSDGSVVAEVVGWGRRSKIDGTNKLTATPIPIRHAAYCWFMNGIRRWSDNTALGQICYGGGSSWPTWPGSCLDDGGAPIVKRSSNSPDQDVQIGIVSYSLVSDRSPMTCDPHLPGVATRVSYFHDAFIFPWIGKSQNQDDGGEPWKT